MEAQIIPNGLINEMTPNEVLAKIFGDALKDEGEKIFNAIRLVCKRWLDIVDAITVRELMIPNICVSPETTVSTYFKIKFDLKTTSPYPVPKTLPDDVEFFKQIGNKLIYTAPQSIYVYFCDTKSHTQIRGSAMDGGFNNIYALGSDCLIIEPMRSAPHKIYRFLETSVYEEVSWDLWLKTRNIDLFFDFEIKKVLTDEKAQTTYLFASSNFFFIHDTTQSGYVFEVGESHIDVSAIDIPIQSTIFGIKNNKIFIKSSGLVQVLFLNENSVETIKNFSDKEYEICSTQAQLAYPFILTEIKVILSATKCFDTLFFVTNTESSSTQPIEWGKKSIKCLACDDAFVFAYSGCFVIYRPYLQSYKTIPCPPTFDLTSCEKLGSPNRHFIKRTHRLTKEHLFQESLQSVYVCPPSVLEDAKKIEEIL